MTKHIAETMDGIAYLELRVVKIGKDEIWVEPSMADHSGQVFVGPRCTLRENDKYSFGVARRNAPPNWKVKADN